MKLNKILNFKYVRILIVIVLCLYILYNVYHGTMKYMEAFKVESEDGLIDVNKMTQKMEEKIEQYKNLIDKIENINNDLISN